MSICILAAGKVVVLAGTAFTLAWTHSVEKTRWEEDWTVTSSGLEIVEARIQGAGAGMEPPEGSRLKAGWWTYAPNVKPQHRLILATSGATESGWTLCSAGGCTTVGDQPGDPAVVTACNGHAR